MIPANDPPAAGAAPSLPIDLRYAIAALSQRFNACQLISLKDLQDELPTREVSRAEIDGLVMSLADHGICIVEGDAADLLAR